MKKLTLLLLAVVATSAWAQTGPGGVGTTDASSSLKAWYRTDIGVTPLFGFFADSLENIAGDPDLGLSGTGSVRPFIFYNALNGYNTLGFLGFQRLRTGTTLTTSNFIVDEASTFTVAEAYNTTQSSCVYTTDPLVGSTRFSNHLPWSGTVYYDIGTCCSNTARIQVGGLTNLTSFNFWSYDANPTDGKQLYQNGNLLQNRAGTSTYSGHATHRFNIGGFTSGTAGFVGEMAEIIIFNETVNDAQRIIIENYLSAKFDIDFNVASNNDIYVQDDAANGDYDHHVAGIGRVNSTNLHDDSQGTGIIRMLNPSGLGDDEYLFWGANDSDFYFNQPNDVPAGVLSRLEQTWRVTETDISGTAVDVGNVDIYIDLTTLSAYTAADLRLIIDTDNDGQFSDETALTGSVVGSTLQFTSISTISNNVRFAIGSISEGDITWDGIAYKGGTGTAGAPGVNDIARRFLVLGNGANISEDGVVKTMTVESGEDITIDSSFYLQIAENIINEGTVTVSNGGELLQMAAGANTNTGSGDYVIEVRGNPDDFVYNVWASPIQAANITTVFPTTNPCDVYAFQSDIQFWRYDYVLGSSVTCSGNTFTLSSTDVLPTGDGTMDVGRGYFIPGITTELRSYTGTVNNGDITYPVETTSLGNHPQWDNDDWNLLGNPYPSSISATQFWNNNIASVTDGLYFWDEGDTTGGYHQYDDYASWNLLGGVNSGNSAKIPNGHIAPGQGFWFYTLINTNVTFTNSLRTDTSGLFFKKEQEQDVNHKIWLGLTNPDGFQSNILVGFNNHSTDAFDKNFDAHKPQGNPHLKLASNIGLEEFMIQGVKAVEPFQTKKIKLTVFSDISGIHQFENFKLENLSNEYKLYLYDDVIGTAHVLTSGSYNVDLDANTVYDNRFELWIKYTPNPDESNASTDVVASTDNIDENGYQLLTSGNLIQLNNQNGIEGVVTVVDVTGKVIWSTNALVGTNNINIPMDDLSSGVYFIQVTKNDEQLFMQKMVR